MCGSYTVCTINESWTDWTIWLPSFLLDAPLIIINVLNVLKSLFYSPNSSQNRIFPGETWSGLLSHCTPDPHCYAVSEFLAIYGVALTCANGTAPINMWGDCADNSTYGCHVGLDIPTGMPKSAFPNNDTFFFCYSSNRQVTPWQTYTKELERTPW